MWTPVLVLGKSDKVIVTIMRVVRASFITKGVLKFNFHICRASLMLVDFCSSDGKIKKSVFTVVEVVKASFSTSNVLNPNFHNCRVGAMLVDSCISTGKKR